MTTTPVLPRPAPEGAPLCGDRIDLIKVDPAVHGPDLWDSIGAHRDLWAGIPSGPFESQADFLEWVSDRAERKNVVLYAIMDKRPADGGRPRAAGIFFLLNLVPDMGVAEVGLVYGAALSRRATGTEAFYLLARHIFADLGYRRLEWRCNTDNAPSLRAAVRYGFRVEGVLRQAMWAKGANWDTVVHSILDHEWPTLDAAFRSWLSPENFRPDGSQIRPLADFTGYRFASNA